MQFGVTSPQWLELRRAALYARRALRRWGAQDGSGGGGGVDEPRAEFYRELWSSAAAALGDDARFRELDDGFWEVRFRGRCTRMARGMVMLDTPVAVALAGHKPLVHRLLAAADLPVPPHHEFTLATIAQADAFLREHGSPCVVKPSRDCGGGEGVTTHITRANLVRAALTASVHNRQILIERQISGDSYRLLYLHGRLLHAIRRHPPRVTGDGRSTIRQLIAAENLRRDRAGGASVTRVLVDLDLETSLRHAGYSLGSVPGAGVAVVVKTTVNDNATSENVAVTGEIGAALRDDGAQAAAALGLALAGVDVITSDPGVSLHQAGGVIIEVNATPGLHHNYNVEHPEEVDVAVPLLRCLLGQSD